MSKTYVYIFHFFFFLSKLFILNYTIKFMNISALLENIWDTGKLVVLIFERGSVVIYYEKLMQAKKMSIQFFLAAQLMIKQVFLAKVFIKANVQIVILNYSFFYLYWFWYFSLITNKKDDFYQPCWGWNIRFSAFSQRFSLPGCVLLLQKP